MNCAGWPACGWRMGKNFTFKEEISNDYLYCDFRSIYPCQQEVEGFLNHKGEFLDRYEAYAHALMCGQLSDTTLHTKFLERILFSEDIS